MRLRELQNANLTISIRDEFEVYKFRDEKSIPDLWLKMHNTNSKRGQQYFSFFYIQ